MGSYLRNASPIRGHKAVRARRTRILVVTELSVSESSFDPPKPPAEQLTREEDYIVTPSRVGPAIG